MLEKSVSSDTGTGYDEVGGVTAGRDEDIAVWGGDPGAALIALTQSIVTFDESSRPKSNLSQVGGLTAEPRGNRDRRGHGVTGGRRESDNQPSVWCVCDDGSSGCRWPAQSAAALALAQFVLPLQ